MSKQRHLYRFCSPRRFIFAAIFAVLISLSLLLYVMYNLPTVGRVESTRDNEQRLAVSDHHEHSHIDIPKQKYSRKGLVAEGDFFTLNGSKIQILSGAMHYFRVPPEYWFDRLTKLKAMGLNTVETYVAWNLHEKFKGHFDFSGQLDIVRYISVAKEVGLYVIVRPGPYICAEWEFGGFPAWLLEDANMKVRSTYKGYIEAVETYFSKLLPRLTPLQYAQGGPIIAVQIENEYGTYDSDKDYLQWSKTVLEKFGITELLFTSDGDRIGLLENGTLPSVLAVVNFQKRAEAGLSLLKSFQPRRPLMVGEFWSGWFDHWSEKRHVLAMHNYTEALEDILSRGASVNLYMFHGGTNFGFMNGANVRRFKEHLFDPYPLFLPTVTSYDYDAPLTENGAITKKYLKSQEMLQTYNPSFVLTDELKKFIQSDTPAAKTYGELTCSAVLTLSEILKVLKPLGSIERPTNVENVCQQIGTSSCKNPLYGFVAYRYKGTFVRNQTLAIKGVLRDRMQVIVNGETLATVYSENDGADMSFATQFPQDATDLVLLVENLGRKNFDKYPNTLDNQRKGFIGQVSVEAEELKGKWLIYDLSFEPDSLKNITKYSKWDQSDNLSIIRKEPAIYLFELNIDEQASPQDTFVNIEKWTKGVVFANMNNIGRYWNLGPQKTLYLPAPYLQDNHNTIFVFELHKGQTKISLQKKADLGESCEIPCYVSD